MCFSPFTYVRLWVTGRKKYLFLVWLQKQAISAVVFSGFWFQKQITLQHPDLPPSGCCRVILTIWTADIQIPQKQELFHAWTAHKHRVSGVFMRCIDAWPALSWTICSQITGTLDESTFFCLLRFSVRCCVLTTGVAVLLVMTQHPQALRQFVSFLPYFQSPCFLSQRTDTLLINFLSDFVFCFVISFPHQACVCWL